MKPMPPAVETDVARGRFGRLVPGIGGCAMDLGLKPDVDVGAIYK